MLTGQAKKDYQREYMKRRRAMLDPMLDPISTSSYNISYNSKPISYNSKPVDEVLTYEIDADGNVIPEGN